MTSYIKKHHDEKNYVFNRCCCVYNNCIILLLSQPGGSWKVPEHYDKLKNPVPSDEASVASGKELYNYFCLSCHGNDGKGSGKRAYKLNNTPTDFTTESFQSQSDGALLYKIYSGHSEMPGFKKRIPETKMQWKAVLVKPAYRAISLTM
ncbi:MAG: c-type cytochrome [Chitinophagaceae bacterium]|nr:c-type cytochrome [Chitinophagaceae bacterium]